MSTFTKAPRRALVKDDYVMIVCPVIGCFAGLVTAFDEKAQTIEIAPNHFIPYDEKDTLAGYLNDDEKTATFYYGEEDLHIYIVKSAQTESKYLGV